MTFQSVSLRSMRMRSRRYGLAAAAAATVTGAAALAWGLGVGDSLHAEATPTRVTVRAVARDAKIIGSGVGGVGIRIEDAKTGKVLAEGEMQGGTGDTRRIMSTPRERGMTVYDTEGAAAFVAELSLSKPTQVTIRAQGPLSYPQAMASASKSMLLAPGRHIEGEGVILELHGFIVEILAPEPSSPVADAVNVTARVRMMCGCPIEPGGLWDARTKEIVARLKSDGSVIATAPLTFSGRTSVFEGRVEIPASARDGELSLEVIAAEPGTENFGLHEIELESRATGDQ